MEKQTLRQWIENFNSGTYDVSDRRTQIEAGWFDWFCKDTSLAAKTKKMGKIIKQVKAGGKVDLQTMYVWFKNSCPMNGPLYDDFRFADLATGKTMMTIQIDCCWNEYRYTVYARRKVDGEFNTDVPAYKCVSSRELVRWLNTPWEEK